MANSLESKSNYEGCDCVPNRKRRRENLDEESEDEAAHSNDSDCSTTVKITTVHISSPILAAKSPFFYKLFKNGMRESHHRDVTLRINASAVMDLLKFMYSNTLSATSAPNLLGVLMAADKFELTACVRYCSELLQKMPTSLESAISYLELPSSVLVGGVVQPLVDAAKQYLTAHYRDITKSQEEVMALPLSALEVVLGCDGLQVNSEASVFDFILKWARVHYPKLEEHREILTKRLAQFIWILYTSCSKLKKVLACPDFDHEEVSKLVLEALFSKIEVPYGEEIHPSKDLASNRCSSFPRRVYKYRLIKELV